MKKQKFYSVQVNPNSKIKGEKGDNFYLILKGEVILLMAKEIKLIMTEEEYLDYLEKLQKCEEYHLMNKCIVANKKLINISQPHANSKKIYRRQARIEGRSSMLNVNDTKIVELKEDLKIFTTFVDYKEYIEKTKPCNKPDNHYYQNTNEFSVFQYFYISSLKTGDYFGDLALTNADQKR